MNRPLDFPDSVCYGDVITSMLCEHCLTCKFYRADPDAWRAGEDLGRCHRFPPVVESPEMNIDGDPASYAHPIVTWDGYCGEWRPGDRTDPWRTPLFTPGYRIGKPLDTPKPEKGEPTAAEELNQYDYVRSPDPELDETKRLLRVAIDDIKFLMDPRAGISAFNEKEFQNNVRRAEKFLNTDAGSEDPRA